MNDALLVARRAQLAARAQSVRRLEAAHRASAIAVALVYRERVRAFAFAFSDRPRVSARARFPWEVL